MFRQLERSATTPGEITDDVLRWLGDGLLYGPPSAKQFKFFRFGGAYPEVPGVWAQCREQVLRDWIESFPASRPRTWWHFDAPRDRLCERWIPGDDRSVKVKQESEAAFLLRHCLLSADERLYVNKHPELLEEINVNGE